MDFNHMWQNYDMGLVDELISFWYTEVNVQNHRGKIPITLTDQVT